jgi:bilirubin oxidase
VVAVVTRRQLLKAGAVGGAAVLTPWPSFRPAWAALLGGTLDPTTVDKYVTRLVVPPAMPSVTSIRNRSIDFYLIAVRQFRQQILPPGWPMTTVWSYGSIPHRKTFHYPAFTIEAAVDRPVRVKWVNDLVDGDGGYLPHLLPVDPTLHWANPPGGLSGRDMRPSFASTPGRYTGPVPIVTHLHGGHTTQESDGYPEAWYLPDATDIPAGYAPVGSRYNQFKAAFADRWEEIWEPGTSVFQYQNDQPATTLWYHDHTLGMTRQNVYAGPAGFYLLRGGVADLPPGVLPGPAPRPGDPPGSSYYEIPIAIQDRSFHQDGSLFYPESREFFDGFAGPYLPDSDVPPLWNPEFFGNTIVTNGRSWPVLPVERRRYRLRFLNGCNSRFLILKIVTAPTAPRPVPAALPFWQIGPTGASCPRRWSWTNCSPVRRSGPTSWWTSPAFRPGPSST